MEPTQTMETETRRVADLIRQFENNQCGVSSYRKLGTNGEEREDFCCSREKYLDARSKLLKHWNYCETTTWSCRRPARSLKHTWLQEPEKERVKYEDGRIICKDPAQQRNDSETSSAEYHNVPLHFDFSDSDDYFFSATSLSHKSSSNDMTSDENFGNGSSERADKTRAVIPPLNLYESCLSEVHSDNESSDSDDELGAEFISAQSSTSTMSDADERGTARMATKLTDDDEYYTDELCTVYDRLRVEPQVRKDNLEVPNSARSIATITPRASGSADAHDEESPITDLSGKRVEALFAEIYNATIIDDDMDNKFAQLFQDTFQNKQEEFDMAVQLYASIVP